MLSEFLSKNIQRIQVVSARLAKNLLAGSYHSAFKGRGMEFEEVREYQVGDEIRNIDWNVTARMNHPYVKNFREERDLTVMLLVDVSASTRFGGQFGLKSDLLAEIAALIAFSAIKNNDRIGLILFSDQVEKYIPPGKGSRHILRLIRDLLVFKPIHKGSNLKEVLAFLGKVQTKSAICFLLSDFLFSLQLTELAVTATKHDLIAMMISDPHEETFPNLGLVSVQDAESNKTAVVDTRNLVLKTKEQQQSIQKVLMKMGIDCVAIRTDQSYAQILHAFFKKRATMLRR